MTATSAAAAAGATVHGYPRQGPNRELKKAVEGYWKGRVTAAGLQQTAKDLRAANWRQLAETGIHEVPTGDFSYYDHMLDTSVMVGAVPERHRAAVAADTLAGYFAMARGTQDVAPLEMTKWFDTNYHYLVPELGPDTVFAADATKQVTELKEALALGLAARPVLVGPVTYLLLAKPAPGVAADFEPLSLLERLLPVYAELLADLRAAGAAWVQLDEPALIQDRTPQELAAAERAHRALGGLTDRPKLLVASYFDRLGDALPVLAKAPVDGLAVDFTGAAAANLDALAAVGGLPGKRLVAGVVNGRNIWIDDLEKSLTTLGTLLGLAGRVDVSASCSLLHVPLDAQAEGDIDPEVLRWLSFARQKTAEIATLAKGLAQGTDTIGAELAANRAALASPHRLRTHPRPGGAGPGRGRHGGRDPPLPVLRRAHLGAARALRLPLLPTTTIGSFPQTTELRTARADLRAGRIDPDAYEERIRTEIRDVLAFQEKAGIDVLVHGEPERNDMVQYFAEQLTGYLATRHGWVQSYGTRYVRPPILAGDLSRPEPMTVRWARYARSLTERPVKGMLTGPVTMLAWSFVRDDSPSGTRHARSPSRCATKWATWRPPAPRSSRSTNPHCARPSRCAPPTARPTWPGRPRRSASPPPEYGPTPRSTPTCATPSSATSCRRSTIWTPTSSAWRPPAPTCRSPTNWPDTATPAKPAPASTTSTPPGCPVPKRPRPCSARASKPSRPSGCGSTPTAASRPAAGRDQGLPGEPGHRRTNHPCGAAGQYVLIPVRGPERPGCAAAPARGPVPVPARREAGQDGPGAAAKSGSAGHRRAPPTRSSPHDRRAALRPPHRPPGSHQRAGAPLPRAVRGPDRVGRRGHGMGRERRVHGRGGPHVRDPAAQPGRPGAPAARRTVGVRPAPAGVRPGEKAVLIGWWVRALTGRSGSAPRSDPRT